MLTKIKNNVKMVIRMERLEMLSTIYGAIIAIERILNKIELSQYERQRLEDSLHYLNMLYEDRKKNKHK